MNAATEFFINAYCKLSEVPEWQDEIIYVQDIKPLQEQHADNFFREYVWVVLNAGMKEQIARKIFERYMETNDILTIGHLGKRKAISSAFDKKEIWFNKLKTAPNKLLYMESLPWIGPITKYHLARNIGIDTVKPDRHLVRLAKRFGFPTPLKMCQNIQEEIGHSEKLGVIDVVLWRWCNLYGSEP